MCQYNFDVSSEDVSKANAPSIVYIEYTETTNNVKQNTY
jgi:hypothetical protein